MLEVGLLRVVSGHSAEIRHLSLADVSPADRFECSEQEIGKQRQQFVHYLIMDSSHFHNMISEKEMGQKKLE